MMEAESLMRERQPETGSRFASIGEMVIATGLIALLNIGTNKEFPIGMLTTQGRLETKDFSKGIREVLGEVEARLGELASTMVAI